jgi:chitinase
MSKGKEVLSRRSIGRNTTMSQIKTHQDASTTINFSITNKTSWPITLSGTNNNGSVNATILSNAPTCTWVGSAENNTYVIIISDTSTNPASTITGGLSAGISNGITGTRGWIDVTNPYESSLLMSATISGGSLETTTYTDNTSGGTNWLSWKGTVNADRFTSIDITYTQSVVPKPYVPGPGPIPIWTPTVGTKAIFYHQQWDCYGASTWPTSQPNGVNVATNTGRNYLISDIPDDVLDLAYAFWYVDANGNVQSADDWADHDNSLANQTSITANQGEIFPYENPDQSNPPPENQPANAFSKGNQYPVWRPTRVCGNFGQILALNAARKARGVPPLNTSLTIGGWTFSTYFSSAVSPANQANFVASCVTALKLWADVFNGINFDWEYISDNGINYGNSGGQCYPNGPTLPPNLCTPSDVTNFAAFLKALRAAINADPLLNSQNIKIGIPVTPAPEKAQFDVNLIAGLVDEIHVMTYDFHSGSFPGDTQTGFHSNPLSIIDKTNYPTPPYSTIDSINFYLGKSGQAPGRPVGESIPSVPPSKLFLGVAFYSRGYSATKGPYTPASSTNSPPNISAIYDSLTTDLGVLPYWQIVTLPSTVPGSSDILNDNDTQAAYWMSNDAEGNFLSFDNPTSINCKFSKIVNPLGLGGILAWDNASDLRGKDANNKSLPSSLTNCIASNIKTQNTKNRLVSSRHRNTYVNEVKIKKN